MMQNVPCLSGYKGDELLGCRAGQGGRKEGSIFFCVIGGEGWTWLAEKTKDYSLFLCIQSGVCTELSFSLNDFHST